MPDPVLVLSKDHAEIFFSVCANESIVVSCGFYAVNIDTGIHRSLDMLGPGWVAPDGQHAIANPGEPIFSFYVEQGQGTQNIGQATAAVWFPENRFIVSGEYYHEVSDSADGITLVNEVPDDYRTIVADLYAAEIVISPDAQQLSFTQIERYGMETLSLWLVNLDGSGLRKVMDLPSDVTDLAWR
jgi:hypothetical protein